MGLDASPDNCVSGRCALTTVHLRAVGWETSWVREVEMERPARETRARHFLFRREGCLFRVAHAAKASADVGIAALERKRSVGIVGDICIQVVP